MIAESIIEAVVREPGIRQNYLPLITGHHRADLNKWILELCALGLVERVGSGRTFRLYLKGDVPSEKSERHRPSGMWQMNDTDFNKGHGNVFFTAFDRMVEAARCRAMGKYEQLQV